jgi:hypothetical protein
VDIGDIGTVAFKSEGTVNHFLAELTHGFVRRDTRHTLNPLLDRGVGSVLDELAEETEADANCYIEKCPKEAEADHYDQVS